MNFLSSFTVPHFPPAVPSECDYADLVATRKLCHSCQPQLKNASYIDGGKHDSEHIGPYTRWQGDLSASVMVVGQDFADVESFRKYEGCPGEDVQTNVALTQLLSFNGFGEALKRQELFFTNAVLCMKGDSKPGRQQYISRRHFNSCRPYLRRTIEIVAPRVVVTLGVEALRSVWAAFRKGPAPSLRDIAGQLIDLHQRTQLLPVYHPSMTVQRTCRSFDQMKHDWLPITRFAPSRA